MRFARGFEGERVCLTLSWCGYVKRDKNRIIAANLNLPEIGRCGPIDVHRWVCPAQDEIPAILPSGQIADSLRNSNEGRKRVAHFSATCQKQAEQPDHKSHLQNVSAEVLILNDLGKHLLNVCGIDPYSLFLEVGPFKRDLVEELLHDGM